MAGTQKATSDIYGVDPVIYNEADNYAPNRLEYFAGLALQGLLHTSTLSHRGRVVAEALNLAIQMEEALDSTKG